MTTADAFVSGIDRSVLGSLDKRFAALLGLSMAAHFALATFISTQPVLRTEEWAEEPLTTPTRRVVLPLPVPKPEQTAASSPTQTAKPKGPAAQQPSGGRGQRVDFQKVGLIGVIGATGGKDSAFGELLQEKSTNSLEKALANAGTVRAATVAEAAVERKDTGPTTQTVDPLTTDGTKRVRLGERGLKGPGPGKDTTVVWDPPEVPQDLAGLQQFVNARKKSVQHCYERELPRNPSLKGRLLVRLTLDGPGRASSVDVDDEGMGNDAVASCVRTIISGWVFPFQAHANVDLPFMFDRVQ